MARLRVNAVSVEAAVRRDLAPEVRRKELADLARKGLKESQETNRQALGYVPKHETFVNGRKGAALETIDPDRGSIVFTFDLFLDVLEFIDAHLTLNSPVLTGTYARSHLCLADDMPTDPQAPAPARTYTFVNTQPYARKLERAQAVYEGVAAVAAARFGNVASIRFSYASALVGAVNDWANATSLFRGGRRMSAKARADWLRRNPAIVVQVR